MVDSITWLNIAIIGVGLLLILVETLQPGFFIGAVGSTLAMVGVVGLVVPWVYTLGGWTILLILLLGTVSVLVNMWIYKRWGEPGEKPVTLAADSLPGMKGKVEAAIPSGGTGKVRVHGQLWRAEATEELPLNTRVRVISVDGLILTVEKDA